MLDLIFPSQFGNAYRGHKLALWLFVPVVIMKLLISGNSIFLGEMVVRSADGIPLDTYTPAGAQTVVSLFAIWGLAHLMLALICLLAIFRYRAMIPFMFALLLLEHLSRKIILVFLPIARVGVGPSPGTIVNIVLPAVMFVGLVLSLRREGAVGQEPVSRLG